MRRQDDPSAGVWWTWEVRAAAVASVGAKCFQGRVLRLAVACWAGRGSTGHPPTIGPSHSFTWPIRSSPGVRGWPLEAAWPSLCMLGAFLVQSCCRLWEGGF